jgi:hypothetical protein
VSRFLTAIIATRSGIISSASSTPPRGGASPYCRMLPYLPPDKSERTGASVAGLVPWIIGARPLDW